MKKVKKTHWIYIYHFVLLNFSYSIYTLCHKTKKEGLCALLKMYKYSSYASWIASNTAAPLLTSYGKVVELSSNVML